MRYPSRRTLALAVGFAAFAKGAAATTMSPDPVLFQGLFPQPLATPAALRTPRGAWVAAKLRVVNNGRAPLRISEVASVTPELVDAGGGVVRFSGGSNMGRAVRPQDVVTLAPGEARDILAAGSLRLAGRELSWRGGDGWTGFWTIDPVAAYGLRLRYSPHDESAWKGVGLTQTAPVPLK